MNPDAQVRGGNRSWSCALAFRHCFQDTVHVVLPYGVHQGTRVKKLESLESLCFVHLFHLVFPNTVSVMKEMNFSLSV